jgi:hypothetical protein
MGMVEKGKETTAGLNMAVQEVANRLEDAGFEIFGIEPWGGGLPACRRPYCVQIALAVPKSHEENG